MAVNVQKIIVTLIFVQQLQLLLLRIGMEVTTVLLIINVMTVDNNMKMGSVRLSTVRSVSSHSNIMVRSTISVQQWTRIIWLLGVLSRYGNTFIKSKLQVEFYAD